MEELLNYLEQPYIQKIAINIVGAIVIFAIIRILKNITPRYVKETNNRYRIRKFINYIGYLAFCLLLLVVYSNQLAGLTIFLGVAGAGVAFALQEIIVSVAGFITINFSNSYSVGDRIMLGGIKGDVVDIGILRTSLMQIGDWVDGDLYNGRIVSIANSYVFKEPAYNYSGEFPFLWDEVRIPIKTEGDYEYAQEKFLEILDEIQGDYAKNAQIHWSKMTEKMMIEKAQVAPMVTLAFDESWITFTLRFVVDYKKRRSTKHLIYMKVLEVIKKSEGRLAVASAAMEITRFPKQ